MIFLISIFILNFDQAHPWFRDVPWDRLYEMEAAFKPEVNGELDTQNFMKYDEVRSCMFMSSFNIGSKFCSLLLCLKFK